MNVENVPDPMGPLDSYLWETRSIASEMILIGVSATWDGPLRKGEDCPTCGGSPKANHYCIRCDRWGRDRDPGLRLPGLPVGKYLDPEYQEQ